jgi:hypothetical protein
VRHNAGGVAAQGADAAEHAEAVEVLAVPAAVRIAAQMKSSTSAGAVWIGTTTALRPAATRDAVMPAGDFTWAMGSPMIG